VIDIGTNSIKVLGAEVSAGGMIEALWEDTAQTRLGAGLYDSGCLGEAAMERTAEAVRVMVEEAHLRGAGAVLAVATSAAREASNRGEFLRMVRHVSGVDVRVLSGDEEAEWTYRGAISGMGMVEGLVVVVDVGGGSTEIVVGRGGEVLFRCSRPLGTVRCLEKLVVREHPSVGQREACLRWVGEELEREVVPGLSAVVGGFRESGLSVVGASGTATILARLERGVDTYDRAKLEGTYITRAGLAGWCDRLWGVGLAERRLVPGMPGDRADVMVTGVAIYSKVVEVLGAEGLGISLRGLRYGALSCF
jgi:exopolyphosphatase/guanosine-5'-triphosphate,3'-diphosphate pyrophosphatase